LNNLTRQLALLPLFLLLCASCASKSSGNGGGDPNTIILNQFSLTLTPDKLDYCWNTDDPPPPLLGIFIGQITLKNESTEPHLVEIGLDSHPGEKLSLAPLSARLDAGESATFNVLVTEYFEGVQNLRLNVSDIVSGIAQDPQTLDIAVTGKKCEPPPPSGSSSTTTVVVKPEAILAMISDFFGKTTTAVSDSGSSKILAAGTVTPSSNVALAGSNGWAVVNPLTGSTVNSNGLDLGSTAKYAAAEVVDPGTGTEAIFAVGPNGTTLNHWIPASSEFGFTQLGSLGANVTDFCRFPDNSGGALVDYSNGYIQFLSFDSGSGFFIVSGFPDAIDSSAFVGASGHPISACTDGPHSRVFALTDGAPGSLWVHENAARPAGAATLIGLVGDAPRNLRMLGNLIVVSNYDSDTLSVARVDTLAVVLTVDVGDGPVGLDLKEQDDGNIAVVSTGLNDNTYSVTVLTPEGALVSNTKTSLSDDCAAPGHAIWYKDGLLVSCHDTDTLRYEVP